MVTALMRLAVAIIEMLTRPEDKQPKDAPKFKKKNYKLFASRRRI